MKHHIFILLLIFLELMGCKNAPTFSPDNELDTQNENFKPAPPFDIELKLNKNDSVLVLEWYQFPDDLNYLDGYIIYKRESAGTKFVQIEKVLKQNNTGRSGGRTYYRITDSVKFNGFFAQYKIVSYLVQSSKDTVFSEPVINAYNNTDFNIEYSITPFQSEPSIGFYFTYSGLLHMKEAVLDLYSKTTEQANYTSIASLQIGETDSHTLPLDINQPADTEYYYKLSLNDIETDYQLITGEISSINLNISNTSESSDHTEFQISLVSNKNETGNYYSVDSFEIEVLEIINENSSQYYTTEVEYTSPTNSFTVPRLNHDNPYALVIVGKRGNYKTEMFYKELQYGFTINERISFPTKEPIMMLLPEGSYNSNSNQLVVYSEHEGPVIIDLDNELINNTLNIGTSGSFTRNAKFGEYAHIKNAIIVSNSAQNIKIYDEASKILRFEIPNFTHEASSSKDFHPVDFEVISEDEMLIVYGDTNLDNRRVTSYFITKWNNATQTHSIIYEVHGNLFSNEFKISYKNNLIALYYTYNNSANSETRKKISIIDNSEYSIISELDLSNLVDLRSEFNIDIANSGEDLYLYSQKSIYRLDIKTLGVLSKHEYLIEETHNNISGFATAENKLLSCFSVGQNGLYQIKCATDDFSKTINFEVYNSGNFGIFLSKNGDKLTTMSHIRINSYKIELKWKTDN